MDLYYVLLLMRSEGETLHHKAHFDEFSTSLRVTHLNTNFNLRVLQVL